MMTTITKINRVPLFNQYRLIERSEHEINGVWKGAHLLLFFLAFVFGSFCTFCFHMLMYLFDEKCVLFPKLLSLTSLRHNVIYEFIPPNKDLSDMPVDFLSTQWVEKSTCSLPTYVPLISGIFGLVWTTMFLMCSTGSRTLTGLQRPWRVLPPVFVFSLAMSVLCIYSSTVTHYGLQELCIKLGEITGSSTCTYTVNVATLTYERRIRGVYQATRLTILSAWLHTACWLLSALLALIRVLLAVDFQLVRINVRLHGDIDKILEKHEVQIRTVSPDIWNDVDDTDDLDATCVLLAKYGFKSHYEAQDELTKLYDNTEVMLMSDLYGEVSELSLVPEERKRIDRLTACKTVPKDKQFIVKWLYDLLDSMYIPEPPGRSLTSLSSSSDDISKDLTLISRQFGRENVTSSGTVIKLSESTLKILETDTHDVARDLHKSDSFTGLELKVKKVSEMFNFLEHDEKPSSSRTRDSDSIMNLYPDMQQVLESKVSRIGEDQNVSQDKKGEKIKNKKSNLKNIGVQTEKKKPRKAVRVQISENIKESESSSDTPSEKKDDVDKETQTAPKEKQD